MISRRSWAITFGGCLAGHYLSGRAVAAAVEEEMQAGDPDLPLQSIRFDPVKLALEPSKGPRKDEEQFARKLVDVSLRYAKRNVNRWDTPDEIRRFLPLLDFPEVDAKSA